MNRWHSFLQSLPTEHVSEGNRVEHIVYDDEILRAIWETLDEAEARVWMSMYALKPDEVGHGTLARLTKAARRGCEVLLVCDYFGSFGLRESDLEPLRRAGGRVVLYNRPWPPWKKNGALLVRDHRKLIIVDDRRALCGGFNMTEEYAEGYDAWVFDDTMAALEGPCVQDLAHFFARTWEEKTGERPTVPAREDASAEASEEADGGVPVAVLEIDPRRRAESLLPRVLEKAIAQAERSCRLATPYFVPPDWLYDALLAAAQRGVDVRILTAGQTDRAIARWAGWHCYAELLNNGVRVHEMFGRILHSKTLAIDGQLGSIGSYNMDAWTSRHTLDLNVVFADEAAASSLQEEFEMGLEMAEEVTPERCEKRSFFSRRLAQIVYHAYRRL